MVGYCEYDVWEVFRFFFGPQRLWTVEAICLRAMTYGNFLEMYEALEVFASLSATIPAWS
jgi:hypothetical protein